MVLIDKVCKVKELFAYPYTHTLTFLPTLISSNAQSVVESKRTTWNFLWGKKNLHLYSRIVREKREFIVAINLMRNIVALVQESLVPPVGCLIF